MKENRKFDEHRCRTVEKKRLNLDRAFCDANYNSKGALESCYSRAREESLRRGNHCKSF